MDQSFIYLILNVDDMLVACMNMYEINTLISHLNVKFKVKDVVVGKKVPIYIYTLLHIKVGIFFYTIKRYIENSIRGAWYVNVKTR